MASRPALLLTLPAALYRFVALGVVLFTLVAVLLAGDRVGTFRDRALAEAVDVRTRGAALAFARALEADWRHLRAFAEHAPLDDPEAMGAMLTVLAGTGERLSWTGFAALDGTVVAASDGLLVGRDVSERPWFRRGLEGPFAGDVHDAVLLNRLLGGTEEDPLRFLDLAAPVLGEAGQGESGRPVGVVGFHISADWAERVLAETAESLGIDLFLVNSEGEVVLGTDEGVAGRLDLPSLRAAIVGRRAAGHEAWPDGRRYFTTVVPEVTYGDLPSFGWRMVGRVDPGVFAGGPGALTPTILLAAAIGGLGLVGLSVVFARVYLAPVAALARNAERLADGHDDYPVEVRRTAELAALSAALARLQDRRS